MWCWNCLQYIRIGVHIIYRDCCAHTNYAESYVVTFTAVAFKQRNCLTYNYYQRLRS